MKIRGRGLRPTHLLVWKMRALLNPLIFARPHAHRGCTPVGTARVSTTANERKWIACNKQTLTVYTIKIPTVTVKVAVTVTATAAVAVAATVTVTVAVVVAVPTVMVLLILAGIGTPENEIKCFEFRHSKNKNRITSL